MQYKIKEFKSENRDSFKKESWFFDFNSVILKTLILKDIIKL